MVVHLHRHYHAGGAKARAWRKCPTRRGDVTGSSARHDYGGTGMGRVRPCPKQPAWSRRRVGAALPMRRVAHCRRRGCDLLCSAVPQATKWPPPRLAVYLPGLVRPVELGASPDVRVTAIIDAGIRTVESARGATDILKSNQYGSGNG
jgi:hypothetical protein